MKPTCKNLLVTAGVAGLMFSGSLLADISLNVQLDAPPPPPRHEVVVESGRPGADYVWVDGYWNGAPGHYVWAAGHWDRPPHANAHWIAPRWERDSGGHYRQVKGEWRN